MGQVELEATGQDTTVVVAVRSKQDTMMEMMHLMMDRLEKLEIQEKRGPPPNTRRFNLQRGQRSGAKSSSSPRQIICFRCHREGHL